MTDAEWRDRWVADSWGGSEPVVVDICPGPGERSIWVIAVDGDQLSDRYRSYAHAVARVVDRVTDYWHVVTRRRCVLLAEIHDLESLIGRKRAELDDLGEVEESGEK